ncbi:MAG: PAS domain-containing sensor histidine kinase [Gammaproteobacteria bacterium]|nr:PAS domain-containing sensor histidine kinase [Gammaproteobacteria bacterium]
MATDPIILAKEIAEFKQAEEALVEAQGKLAHLLSSSPAVIFSFDAKGDHKPSFVSKNIKDLLGYEQHEYLEDTNFWKTRLYPEDADRVTEAMPRLWEEGRLTQEYRFLCKDGTYIWVNDDMRMIRDENGEPREVVGSWSNIEERKKAELALIHAQDRLDHLLSSSPSVIYSFAAKKGDFKCTYISRNVKDLLGYEPREYLEIPDFWKNNIHPDDVERVLNSFPRLWESNRLYLEYRFQKKDKKYCWISDDLILRRDENGNPLEVVGSWSNITAQTQVGEALVAAQDRLSRLISFAPAVIYSLEASGKFNATFVSENIKDLLGYEQSEYLDDRDFWANNLHPDDKRRALKEFHNVWKTGRFDSEYRFKKKDGHYTWVRDQLQLVKGDNGNPKEIVGAWSDIDQQKHAEEALKIAKEQAETANRTKTQFVAKISHEFRTPLNSVIGITEMLIEDAKDQENKTLVEPLTRVHRAGQHLLSLINDFLDISKIEAGIIELQIENFDITELINEVVTTVKPMLETNQNTIKIENMTKINNMRSDEKRIKQILLNLLSNASKFTENGNITLRVHTSPEEDSDYYLFDVVDTGAGIPEDQLDRIFDEYSQVKSSKPSKFAGTGLGLPISRKLAQILKGDITVTSKFGEGSTFTVKLPVNAEGDAIQSHKLI